MPATTFRTLLQRLGPRHDFTSLAEGLPELVSHLSPFAGSKHLPPKAGQTPAFPFILMVLPVCRGFGSWADGTSGPGGERYGWSC